jgi:hypothetical protein
MRGAIRSGAAQGASPDAAAEKIETLTKRGLISLVCNIAVRHLCAHSRTECRVCLHAGHVAVVELG